MREGMGMGWTASSAKRGAPSQPAVTHHAPLSTSSAISHPHSLYSSFTRSSRHLSSTVSPTSPFPHSALAPTFLVANSPALPSPIGGFRLNSPPLPSRFRRMAGLTNTLRLGALDQAVAASVELLKHPQHRNQRFRSQRVAVRAAAEGGADLSVTVNGLKLPNPFVIGSGPPGTNYTVMKKAFDEGWGGVIAKTVSLDSFKVVNVTPRYARLKAQAAAGTKAEVIGWQNIELISDRPFETMLAEMKQLKEEYPDRILIASIMEEYNRDAWEEIIERVEETGVDAFEINFSCPHGMPERKMGMAMGQDCTVLGEVCGWINAKATIPVWAKMTPNITDITQPARTALNAGCEGVAAINTITSVMGINLDTLRPEPCVEGYSTPGGYSCKAVRPIALAKVMSIAQMMKAEFAGQDKSLSGIGGVETGNHAAEFILLGASTVQVCTGVMLHGYGHVKSLCTELQAFMDKHGFSSIEDFRGASLDYFTTHADLVQRQRAAVEAKKVRKGLASDKDWTGEGFVKETETMVSN